MKSELLKLLIALGTSMYINKDTEEESGSLLDELKNFSPKSKETKIVPYPA